MIARNYTPKKRKSSDVKIFKIIFLVVHCTVNKIWTPINVSLCDIDFEDRFNYFAIKSDKEVVLREAAVLSNENPTYIEEGVLHFAVTNMPGAVPRSASQALSAALLPYVHRIAGAGWKSNPPLARGINIEAGEIVHPALKESLA